MNRYDPRTNQQMEEFNRTLDTMAEFYQQQAYLAGLTQAKQVWDALHTPPRRTRTLARRTKRLLIVTCGLVFGLTAGSALYILTTHPTLPTAQVPQLHPLSYWLNLVK